MAFKRKPQIQSTETMDLAQPIQYAPQPPPQPSGPVNTAPTPPAPPVMNPPVPPGLPPGVNPPKPQTQPFQREQFRDDWMGNTGGNSPADLAAFLKPYGLTADGAGRVKLPTGETMDMLIGAKAGGQGKGWTGVAGGGQKAGQAAGPARSNTAQMPVGSQSILVPDQQTPQANSSDDLQKHLKALMAGGGFYNEQAVSDRTANVRGSLERQRKGRMASNEAALASRGLIGDGPQGSAMNRMEEDLYGQYAEAVTGINADESERADSRMMQALQIGAGMSIEDAKRLIEQYRAETDRTGVTGGLALGNKNADNSFALGQGNLALGNENLNLGYDRLGLDTDIAGYDQSNTRVDQIIKLLDMGIPLADILAGGFIK